MTSQSNEKLNSKEENDKGPFVKVRDIQATLLFFLMLIMYLIRNCLSVAIVAMTTNNTSINPSIPTYKWDNTNIVLSSFFWSYAILQFFAGNLALMFGTKWLLLFSMFMNSLASILIPVTAKFFGSNGVMVCRIIQGLFQGFLLPLLNNALGRWVPPQEISLVNSIVYAGSTIGVIISMVITGYLSASSLGWPASFYIFGFLGIIWCVFWMIFGAETPASHRSIPVKERMYIEQSLDQQDDHLIGKKTVPWKAIFKSLPYWAIIIASIGESWGTTFLSSELPSYFSHAIGLNIEDSGLLSAVPLVASLIASLCYGQIAAYTINKGYTSKVNSRRIFHGIGSLSSALGLAVLPYLEEKTTIAIFLIVTNAVSAGVILGHFVNQIDISPRYAGILCGISNGTGQLFAIFAPILVHFVVKDETDKTLWRYVFIMGAVICTVSAIFFVIFCSGERQWWDNVDQNKRRNENNNKTLSSNGKSDETIESDFVK